MKNYILLYEDNEGDRMLVGDVPWEYVESGNFFMEKLEVVIY
jgi:hypothetical protein